MTDNNRNTILAVILSGLVLLGWQYFFNIPQMEKQRAAEIAARSQTANPAQPTPSPGAAPSRLARRRRQSAPGPPRRPRQLPRRC
ncbi:MAG: hypothetical protein MZV49_16185 [Rhodopseudomonas palustris]|nr:hypothetical protein [Rhodopseudomonas palustris]